MRVREADLGTQTYLGTGGFAKIFRVDFRLPGDPTPLAYKQFTTEHMKQARSATESVAFRTNLSDAERAELDRFTAWPKALVENSSGQVCGLLMSLIPDAFFCRLPNEAGQIESKPREMSWLASSAAQRKAAQVDVRDIEYTERLVVLGQLVYIVGWLHKRGWVFGDLSFGNAVFALDPARIILLDCDGAAALTNLARRQESTPYWDAPECPIAPPPGQRRQQELQDDRTDVYKLGLAILRCLTPGKGAASSRAAGRLTGHLDGPGAGLVGRALSTDRSDRPTAKEVYTYLKQVVAARTAPPEVTRMRLASPFLVRGQDARIDWRISGAQEIEITIASGTKLTVDPAKQPNGFAFRPDESGPVSVVVRNRFASVTFELGELTLYELPPFNIDLNYLPRPMIPAVAAFRPPALAATMSGRPRVAVGGEVVKIPALNVSKFVADLLPPAPLVAPSPRIGEAVEDVSRALRSALTHAGDDLAPLLRRTFLDRLPGTVPER